MKHLKHFNEELNPEKYIRAGSKLKYLGKTSRGSKLVDYGFEKAWGFYNVHLGHISDGNWSLYTGKLTNPECKFYYGTPYWQGPQNNQTSTLIKTHDEEDLLKNWTDGREPLSFTLEFTMQLSEESRLYLTSSGRLSKDYSNRMPLFALNVVLSHWTDGLREYNYMEDPGDGEYLKPGDENYHDVSMMYKNTNDVSLTLMPLFTKNYFGIFSDRKSAVKFKKELPRLVDTHKSQIMDILSLVSGDTDDLEDILSLIYNMSANHLYQDDIPKNNIANTNSLKNTWFNRTFTR
jgi:hypothetical protein